MSATGWGGGLLTLGWTLVLVLWQAAFVALVVSAWNRMRRSSARRRHRNALAALLAGVPLGLLTFWALGHAPSPLRDRVIGVREQLDTILEMARQANAPLPQPAEVAVSRPAPSSHDGPVTVAAPDHGEAGFDLARALRRAIEWGAALWLAIVVIMIGRLAGGLFVLRRIRRRAARIGAVELVETVGRLARRLGIARPVELLESADIDAPMATGWRTAALVLPLGLQSKLSLSLLEPLVAHELEHVRRRDQLMATVQAIADALAFFSPGSRWLSAQARLAREQCCDDVAVRACGDPAAYAAALGALVGIVSEKPCTALGVEAPCLADRIRRVLKGEPVQRMTFPQAVVLALAVVATSVSGLVVAAASFADTAERRAGAPAEVIGADGDALSTVPIGWFNPPGSPVVISALAAGHGNVVDTVHVRNVSEERVTSITFVAVVEFLPASGTLARAVQRLPARVVRSAAIPVSLVPGEGAELKPEFLPVADVMEWQRARGMKAQPGIGVVAVGLARSADWAVTLKPGASDVDDAFYLPKPFVSKALLGVKPTKPLARGECRDDRGYAYSPGAIVSVLEGNPRWARCGAGAWAAYQPPSARD